MRCRRAHYQQSARCLQQTHSWTTAILGSNSLMGSERGNKTIICLLGRVARKRRITTSSASPRAQAAAAAAAAQKGTCLLAPLARFKFVFGANLECAFRVRLLQEYHLGELLPKLQHNLAPDARLERCSERAQWGQRRAPPAWPQVRRQASAARSRGEEEEIGY